MKIIDAHSHIDYITHVCQPDVVGTICCTTQEKQWSELSNLMKTDKRIYGAFGIHPWFAVDATDDFSSRLEKLLRCNSNYMIGEIGLDKYKPNMDKQYDVFIKQFDLAAKLKRTVFLHCVGAWDKILHVFKQYDMSKLPIIVAHGFNANQTILEKLLQYNNIMFSFNKIDINHRTCRIEQIPCDKILVETDGKSDENLIKNIKHLAEITNNIDIDKIVFNNTQRVLKNE